MAKITIRSTSCSWLIAMDEYVRRYDIRGRVDRFRDVASDVLDGWALRRELDDLVRRRLLSVVPLTDAPREADRRLCGTNWTVDLSPRLARTLWPDRICEG